MNDIKYNITDLALKKERDHGGIYVGKHFFWDWESKFSKEEKLYFLDNYAPKYAVGYFTKLYNLFMQYQKDVDSLSKDKTGKVRTVSLVAWIKKNDFTKSIHTTYTYGKLYVFGRDYDITKASPLSSRILHPNSLIDTWFHDCLEILYKEELTYFQQIDPYYITKRKLKELCGECLGTTLDSEVINNIVYNRSDDYTMEHMEAHIKLLEELNETLKGYYLRAKAIDESFSK